MAYTGSRCYDTKPCRHQSQSLGCNIVAPHARKSEMVCSCRHAVEALLVGALAVVVSKLPFRAMAFGRVQRITGFAQASICVVSK